MSGESWRKKVSWSYRGEPLQDEDETVNFNQIEIFTRNRIH